MSAQGLTAWGRDDFGPAFTAPERCQDEPVAADLAGVVGRVQATLIGAGRVGVVFGGDPRSALLLTISARALGAQRVALVLDPTQRPAPAADALAQLVADALGLPVLRTWRSAGHGSARRALAELPIDTIAYCDVAEARSGAPMHAVRRQRVIFPFAEAGLSGCDIAACARALGLQTGSVDETGT